MADTQPTGITDAERKGAWNTVGLGGSAPQEVPMSQWDVFTDPDTGRRFLQSPSTGDRVEATPKPMGPVYDPDLVTIKTPKGDMLVDRKAVPPGTIIPGTEPPPAAPEIVDVGGNKYTAVPDSSVPGGIRLQLVQDKTLTPGYQPPAAPQGPAYSGTEPGIRLTNELDIAKQKLGSDLDTSRSFAVQGQQFELNTIRDKAQAEQVMARDKAQAETAKAQFEAEQLIVRAQLYDDIRLGYKTTAQGKAALDQWTAMNTSDYQAHVQRIHDIDEYNRNLPQLQAQEDRAARTEQRAGQQDKVSALKGQADAGMSAADRMVKLGVSPSDASLRMAYDPYPRMWAILNEKPAAAPQLQTQVAPAAPTPRPMPNIVPPQFAPAAPGASMTAPPAPYGGDANAQAAFEGQYPGQDAEEIWRQQRAANGGR